MNMNEQYCSDSLTLLRLFQLTSPNLPVGGFSYSQGLEWAVEQQWVTNSEHAKEWLKMQMENSLLYCDLPLLKRFYHCYQNQQLDEAEHWLQKLIRYRETTELRQEESQRGQAFFRFIQGLGNEKNLLPPPSLNQSQLAGFAWFATVLSIPLSKLQLSWGYSWLEGAAIASMKLIPLGQQAGHSLIYHLSALLPQIIATANQLADDELGFGSPIVAIASSCHETQYSRLFRS